MGVIRLEGMKFRAHVGTTAQERANGNDVDVTVSYDCDTDTPGRTDNLEDAVDYAMVYVIVAKEVLVECNLIENMAHRILLSIKNNFPEVSNIVVIVRKHYPAVSGNLQCSVVEVHS